MEINSKKRFNEILKVLISYGFGHLVGKSEEEKHSPTNLRKAFEELGPTFIKLGQIMSTRRDMLPKEYIEELKKLQDNVPQENINDVKNTFFQSIGKSIEECFSYFNEEPIASASISQVHEAILKSGERVVVKIQRKEIYELMTTDIAILIKIFSLNKVRNKIKIIDPVEALNELLTITQKELNFLIEAESMIRFKEENKENTIIYAPEVYEDFTSRMVLTQEYIEGFKVNDRENIESCGYNKKDIIRKLALAYCKQVFDYGFFHGDPHPGNILICDGKLSFIDFGIMGAIDDYTKECLNDVMIGIALEDKEKVVDFILAVGIKRGKVDRNNLYEGVTSLFNNYLNTSLKNIKIGNVFEEIIDMAKSNNIAFPSDLALLMRGMLILEGVAADLDPHFDIMEIVIDFVKMESKRTLLDKVTIEEVALKTYSTLRDGAKIPQAVLRVLKGLEEGRTKVQLSVNELNSIISSLDRMVNRLVAGLLIASLIIGSSFIVSSKVGPEFRGVSLLGVIGYILSGILAIVLLISMIKAGEFNYRKK